MPIDPIERADQLAAEQEDRFFIDHDMIHDRITGRHVHGNRDIEPGVADEAVFMLNELHASALREIRRHANTAALEAAEQRVVEAEKERDTANSVVKDMCEDDDELERYLVSKGAFAGDNNGVPTTLTMAREVVEAVEKERDEARSIVANVNNSVFGSQGYFTTPSCVDAVEHLKREHGELWRRVEAAEKRVVSLAGQALGGDRHG